MKVIVFYILALIGGVFLAVQAGFNSHLGNLLKQPVLAVVATSVSSVIFGSITFLLINKKNFNTFLTSQIPWYLWFIGGLFSVLGISLYYYTIPKLGISKMIALGLFGQLIFSLIAGNYGWLHLPVEPITSKRILGTIAMTIGIILINTK